MRQDAFWLSTGLKQPNGHVLCTPGVRYGILKVLQQLKYPNITRGIANVTNSFTHWHTPVSVAVLTTSWQSALLNALRQEEFNPRFTGLSSFSTV